MPTEKELDLKIEAELEFPEIRAEDDPMYRRPNNAKPVVSGSLPSYEEFKLEYERREACDLPKGYSKKDYLAGFHQCYKWIRRQMLVGNDH